MRQGHAGKRHDLVQHVERRRRPAEALVDLS
jgi:hypothetical protein